MIKNFIARGQALLHTRAGAYKTIFSGSNAAGNIIFRDLIGFCRGLDTTFHEDPRLHALLEGRREVLMRIAQHCNLSFDDLWAISDGRIEPHD